MKLDPLRLALLALLPLAACIETEEHVVVHPDLGLDVTLRASGDRGDLRSGYPLPLEGPWAARDGATQAWLDATRRGTVDPDADPGESAELELSASFASADELPRWFAPAAHPYRTAFLERDTQVSVEQRGGRRVYRFERVFRARPEVGHDVWEQAKRALPDDLRDKAEHPEELEPEEWASLLDRLQPRIGEQAAELARDALLGIYTEGDATLSAAGHERIVDEARRVALETCDRATLDRLYELLRAGRSEELGELGRSLEARGREALRDVLAEGLANEGVAVEVANAVLARLEWTYTALDHDDDLADEGFDLSVELPGTIVGGNFDALEDGRATWRFEGKDLYRRDVRMEAVSVLE